MPAHLTSPDPRFLCLSLALLLVHYSISTTVNPPQSHRYSRYCSSFLYPTILLDDETKRKEMWEGQEIYRSSSATGMTAEISYPSPLAAAAAAALLLLLRRSFDVGVAASHYRSSYQQPRVCCLGWRCWGSIQVSRHCALVDVRKQVSSLEYENVRLIRKDAVDIKAFLEGKYP